MVSEPFRCAVASEARDDLLAGSASTTRAFLLVEHPGPWGVTALTDARLPDGLGTELKRRAAEAGAKVLLTRRPNGASKESGGVRVFAAHADHAAPWLETTVLDRIEDAADLDLTALVEGRSLGLTPYDGPLVAVCTHGRHDACCAERGRPVSQALEEAFPGETWEVSHLGGDRYAGNAVVLPRGLYLGRLTPESAREAVRLLRAGEVPLEVLRGRSGFAPPLQVAELALRRHVDERRLDGVRFVSRTRDGDRTEAVLAVDDRTYAVTVETLRGPDRALLTCRADDESAVVRHRVTEIRYTG